MQASLVSAIVGVYSKDGVTPYAYDKVQAVHTSRKYTSTKQPIWRLDIDGIETTRKTQLIIQYRCLTCHCSNTVSMVTFLRKLNGKSIDTCCLCKNKDVDKRLQHSNWMKGKDIRKYRKESSVSKSQYEIYNTSMHNFQNIPENERIAYYKRHLSSDQMKRILPHIVSLRNGHISSERLSKCEYWDVFSSLNQMKFVPVFHDPINDEVIRIDQPIITCEQCGCKWRCKNMKSFVDCVKVLCPTCKLCRKTFKIRSSLNIVGTKITHQSRPEKTFIEWCASHNIIVENGPSLSYVFNNKEHTYKVDFVIPSIGYLIEIKDDHCWHKQQQATGKWACKEQAAFDQIEKGVYSKFLLLTPKTKQNCLQEIVKRVSKI